MKLPDAVIDKLQDGESPVTHAAIIDSGEMIIRYTCILPFSFHGHIQLPFLRSFSLMKSL